MIGLEGNTDFCWLILSLNEERKQKELSGTLDKVLTVSRLTAADWRFASWASFVNQSSFPAFSLAIVCLLSPLGLMFPT